VAPTSPQVGQDIEALRLEFMLRHAVVLRSFLAADERAWVRRQLEEASFHPHTIEETGKAELLMEPNALSALLHFKLCDPEMFDTVEAVTGCGPIGDVRGRTFRMLPGAGHVSRWHDDAVKGRLVAVTVNLSPQAFDGGRLQIKSADDDELLTEMGELDFGDALLIQISRAYQHRSSPLLGTAPKTVHAGFFYPGEPSPLARR
jgi:hypothetical protein